MSPLEKMGLEKAASNLLERGGSAKLLITLLDARGAVVSYERLSKSRSKDSDKWDDVDEKTVSVRVCWLRQALEDIGHEDVIKNHRNRGYSLPEPGRSAIIEQIMESVK